MKNGVKNVVTILLVAVVAALAYINVRSVMRPIEFKQIAAGRDTVVIERLKDIRSAQVEYRKHNGHYTNDFNELIRFVKETSIPIVKKEYELNDFQLECIAGFKKSDINAKETDEVSITPDEADQYVLNLLAASRESGDWTRINQLNRLDNNGQKIQDTFRRDTINKSMIVELYGDENYPVDSLCYVPFGNGNKFELLTDENGDLFEARVDFEVYMKGIDDQELANYLLQIKTENKEVRRIPILDENGEQKRYADGTNVEELIPCRIVGNHKESNNNAGNWQTNQ